MRNLMRDAFCKYEDYCKSIIIYNIHHTLCMIGFGSSISIGIDVLCTHVPVHRCLKRTNEELDKAKGFSWLQHL